MITLCDEETPGGPAWLWGGVEGMGRTPDELLGMRKVAGRRGSVSCPQILPHPSLMSTKAISKHLSLFWKKQSLPSSYSINFVEYVSSIGVQSSALFIPCSVYPPIQPAICSSIHPLTNPSIHPPIHSLTHQIISDPPRRQTPPLLRLPGGPPA